MSKSKSRRPNRVIRPITSQSYCRSEYIGVKPHLELFYKRGKLKGDGIHLYEAVAQVPERIHISANNLGAWMRTSHRFMTRLMKPQAYRILLTIHPHNRHRENRGPQGAGADRISMGMRRAFGKVRSLQAKMTQRNQRVLTIQTLKPLKDIQMRELQRLLDHQFGGKISIKLCN